MAKILVRATATGAYGHKRIKEGQVFELQDMKIKKIDPKTKKETIEVYPAEKQFSEAWMEKVDAKEVKQEPKVKFEQNDNVEVI
jgi:hypothetical protein